MKTRQSRFSNMALGAAVAGIIAGSMLIGGCSKDSKGEGQKTEGNGCNGPNGCGAQKKAEKNACNGHNGCNGAKTEKAAPAATDKNACNGHNTCSAKK